MIARRSFPPPSHGTLAILAGAFTLAASAASLNAEAAPKKPRPAARPAIPPAADFDKLSGARARACEAPFDPRLAAMGQPTQRQCAWSGRVEMLYWRAIPSPAGACLPPAAIAWQRLATTAQTNPVPWNAAWANQSLVTASPGANLGVQQALALWRNADGAWSAVVWRWQPAAKPDTRAWQQSHWNAVVQAVRANGAPTAAPSPLLQAWLDASAGKPRVLDGENWRWVADKACLALQTSNIAQAQLHLPWSRDDARLEQRSAMQVQLARRFPDAEWLQPFTLLDPATPGARTGAKFIAVWKEGAAASSRVTGQLWIPLRDKGGIVRARIDSGVPAGAHSEDAVKQRGDLVERELTALAHAWEARHE